MSVVLVEDRDGVRTITLNRPEKRNALTAEVQDALTMALLDMSGVRIVVLRGAGDAFCAGMDMEALKASVAMSAEAQQVEAERTARMFRAVWACPVPTIAAVRGPAVAGGTGLATLCDFTLATPDAKFGYPEPRIGFVPALVSAYLVQQVGEKVTRGLLLSARVFGADEALRMGMVNEVVVREELDMRVAALVQELLALSPQSLRDTKRMLITQSQDRLDAMLAVGMDANAAARRNEDFQEGVSAFLEKRKPVWK